MLEFANQDLLDGLPDSLAERFRAHQYRPGDHAMTAGEAGQGISPDYRNPVGDNYKEEASGRFNAARGAVLAAFEQGDIDTLRSYAGGYMPRALDGLTPGEAAAFQTTARAYKNRLLQGAPAGIPSSSDAETTVQLPAAKNPEEQTVILVFAQPVGATAVSAAAPGEEATVRFGLHTANQNATPWGKLPVNGGAPAGVGAYDANPTFAFPAVSPGLAEQPTMPLPINTGSGSPGGRGH